MTDREAIELMAFFLAVALACQLWRWTRKTKSDGSDSRQSRPRRLF